MAQTAVSAAIMAWLRSWFEWSYPGSDLFSTALRSDPGGRRGP